MNSHLRQYAMLLLVAASLPVVNGCAVVSDAKPEIGAVAMSDRKLSLARLSERHGKIDEAQLIYERLAEEEPQNQQVHHRLAVVAAKRQKFDQALHHFGVAEQLGAPNAELLTDHGFALYLQNELDKAEAKLRAALELDPHFKAAHNNLAIVLGHQGRYDESLSHFRNAVPEGEALANLAYVQTQVGDLTQAEQTYHSALSNDDSLRPAAEALIQVASRTRGVQVPDIPTASLVRWESPASEQAETPVTAATIEHR